MTPLQKRIRFLFQAWLFYTPFGELRHKKRDAMRQAYEAGYMQRDKEWPADLATKSDKEAFEACFPLPTRHVAWDGQRYAPPPGLSNSDLSDRQNVLFAGFCAGRNLSMKSAQLDAPAQVNGLIFSEGATWADAIEAAQKKYREDSQ